MGKLTVGSVVVIAFLVCGVMPRPSAEGALGSGPRTGAMSGVPSRAGVVFEENRGQTDPCVSFVVRQPGFTAFLAPGGVTLSTASGDAVRMAFRGTSDDAQVEGRDPTGGYSSYFRGSRSVPGARHFTSAVTSGLDPGIDLCWHGDEACRLTYDLVVAPGADPSKIEFDVAGASGLRIASDGTLRIATPRGEIRHGRPVLFQRAAGQRVDVDGAFAMRGDHRVGFEVGAYDRRHPLVIDPTIEYAANFGGAPGVDARGTDEARAIAVDASGAAYVAGVAHSVGFPADPEPGGETGRGPDETDSDGFVTKLSADGRTVVWSVFLGGRLSDEANGIAVNAEGEAFVCGKTRSPDFRVVRAIQPALPPGSIYSGPFVAKIAADARSLLFSTHLGGSAASGNALAIALDAAGHPFVTGTVVAGFSTTAGSFQEASTDPTGDAFVARLEPNGSAVNYATYLGGAQGDDGLGIAVDAAGSAYVCGRTTSGNFPITTDLSLGGPVSGFLAKLSPDGSELAYSVKLIAAGELRAVAVDAAGAAYVTGLSDIYSNPISRMPAGFRDTTGFRDERGRAPYPSRFAYVMKVAPAGEALEYSVRYPGWFSEGHGIALDAGGAANVVGLVSRTRSTPRSTMQIERGKDALVFRLSPDAAEVTYNLVFAGDGTDAAHAVALGPDGSVFVAGRTGQGQAPFDALLAGPTLTENAFVLRLAPQNTRFAIRGGGASAGPGGRGAVQFLGKHEFRKPGSAFDPGAQDVRVTVRAGTNVRTLTIPANDPRWKHRRGGVAVWTSAPGEGPRWIVGFSGRSGFRVVMSDIAFTGALENPFALDLAVGADRGSDQRVWRRLPGPRPRFQMR